ncbi:MAG: tRNA uridine-5-carboxymethylaminomethyl(34) synthesis GTPase MnmE [Prevotellaceae bacterium]|jgi:tRNA modification GTPase|nr:tRNA uridine-5-carboxymethylaminomethyl(34) synthesis GTPase MnmE [Prevotellaceae bacterium]
MLYNKNTTIAAISTPPGVGGIAVIRISGENAIAAVDKLVVPKSKSVHLPTQSSHSVVFGTIMKKNEVLDEVLITVFRAPGSFTGEDTVEISCHGSVYIQQEILKLLIEQGCELARPGEFSQRAFLNGKMDLSQAEAVADLIASISASSHRMALNQMRGYFSNELITLREKLLHFVSMIELELDFNEEDVEFADRNELKILAVEIGQKIGKLADSFDLGNVLKNGIPVALVGETNVGKSTLLNLLLNEEKAIVSDIHGTTRDVIEDSVVINGVTFRFIDTAGIRRTKNKIENLGIERTYQKIEQASIILWLIDSTQVSEHIEWLTERIAKRAEGKKIILVFNKIDRIDGEEHLILDSLFAPFDAERIYISAKKRINTDILQDALLKAAQLPELQAGDIVVSNIRHYEALKKAQTAILRVIKGLENNITHDFLSQDIRECMFHLGEITGQISTGEILGNIFSKFCIGK